jgi:hypothetical protein
VKYTYKKWRMIADKPFKGTLYTHYISMAPHSCTGKPWLSLLIYIFHYIFMNLYGLFHNGNQ